MGNPRFCQEFPSRPSPFTYAVNNAVVGSTLDYYFYDDPVGYGELITFMFYTDNTTDKVNFCISMCPSPVPEPASMAIIGLGGLAMLLRRR